MRSVWLERILLAMIALLGVSQFWIGQRLLGATIFAFFILFAFVKFEEEGW